MISFSSLGMSPFYFLFASYLLFFSNINKILGFVIYDNQEWIKLINNQMCY